ncbi:MAG: hypothetical protein V3T84_10775 [Phycisphaerales bacterium]
MDELLSYFANESFPQNALLLVLGGVLTGILVPYIKARIDHRNFQERRLFEAQLARQRDVIEAQTNFLNAFSDHIWEYHKISQRVSYAKLSGDEEAYKQATEVYKESMWDLLQKVRSAIGASRWFTSDAAHLALRKWYEDWFVTLEARLRELMGKNPPDEIWRQHHMRTHYEAAERNYGLLRFLAEDFGIAAVLEKGQGQEADEKKTGDVT